MNDKGYYYDCDPMIMEIVAIGILVTMYDGIASIVVMLADLFL